MERLGMRSDNRISDDGLTRDDQDDGMPTLPADEPDHRPEQPGAPGVVDAWFFLGW
jgi:hypothetical protein